MERGWILSGSGKDARYVFAVLEFARLEIGNSSKNV
jgi:hypothetical protein